MGTCLALESIVSKLILALKLLLALRKKHHLTYQVSLCNASLDSTKGVEGNISRLKVVQLISSDHTHYLTGVSESKYPLQGQKHSNRHVVNDNISDFVVLLSVLPCYFNILCSFFQHHYFKSIDDNFRFFL